MSGKFFTRVLVLSLSIFLVACGGDENSKPLAKTAKSEKDKQTDPENTTTDSEYTVKPGVYATEISVIGEEAGPVSGITILSSSERFATFVENDGTTFGTINFSLESNIADGTGTYFPVTGEPDTSGTISGEVLSAASLTLGISAASANYEAEARLERNKRLSDTTMNKELLSGVYSMQNTENGSDNISITIDDNLNFTGNYGTPCTLNGSATIPDPNYNVFEASYTAENCDSSQTPNGSYKGLGYIDGSTLNFIATNDTVVTYFVGDK